MISISLGPSQSIWMARHLQQMLARSKLSPPGYKNLILISLCWYTCLRATVEQYVNVCGDYVEVLCVPQAIHVPCTHLRQNEVFGIRMFILFFKNSFTIYLFFWFGYIGSEVGGSKLLKKTVTIYQLSPLKFQKT
jgi:hypothetical protein